MAIDNNEQPSQYDLAIGFLQAFDLILNMSQVSNDRLLQELEKQNDDYFEKIITQNNQILKNQEEILARLRGE